MHTLLLTNPHVLMSLSDDYTTQFTVSRPVQGEEFTCDMSETVSNYSTELLHLFSDSPEAQHFLNAAS